MAAGATYEPIATTTLSSAQSSVTFSSISGSYTDLVCVISGNTSTGDIIIRFNSDSSSNYSYVRIFGDGVSASSDSAISQTSFFVTVGGFTNANSIINIQNYSNSTTNKTTLVRANSVSTGYLGLYVGLWRSTSAITSVTLTANSGNLNSGSTFTLYGIAAA